MPFSSLAGAGFEAHGPIVSRHRRYPHPVRAMLETPPRPPPTDTVPPAMPGDKRPPPESFDQFVEGEEIPHGQGARLQNVRVCDSGVLMHPNWYNTPLRPALMVPTQQEIATHNAHKAKGEQGVPYALDINAVTPAMIEGLAPVTRRSLMDILRSKEFRIGWQDPHGPVRRPHRVLGFMLGKRHVHHVQTYDRRKICGVHVGPHYRVNGATALVMRMAEVADHKPFVDTMVAGLPWVADSLRSRDGFELFQPCDVAAILGEVLHPLPQAPPKEACDMLDAASTLVQRYYEHACNDNPDTFRKAFERVLRGLAPLMPRDADHVGLCIGVMLAGLTKYTGSITTGDNHARWLVASMVNFVWSATSFSPLFLVAGPVAVGVVVGGIIYDRFTPVRDYTMLMGRFEAELTQMLLGAQLPWLPEKELGRLFMRIRQCIKAAGLPT